MTSNLKHTTPGARVDAILKLLKDQGEGEYLGEQISQLEHCLQAANLALLAQSDSETIVAALLHDIGQFVPGRETHALLYGDQIVGKCEHEKLGADYLRSLGLKECDPALSAMIDPKGLIWMSTGRYLCAVSEEYHATLSSASKKSLIMQGGPFSPQQVEDFRSDPLWPEKVQLRKWDDAAKVVGLKTPGLEVYRQMILDSIAV